LPFLKTFFAMTTFEEWASVAVDDVLAQHGGSMHWMDLRRKLVQTYYDANMQQSLSQSMKRRIGDMALASIPDTHLSHDDAIVRLGSLRPDKTSMEVLSRCSSYCLPSFEAWAIETLNDELSKHGGCMHWQDLQKSLAQRYFSESTVEEQGLVPCATQIEHRVLAVIPETHLSHHDEMIRSVAHQAAALPKGHGSEASSVSESTEENSHSRWLGKLTVHRISSWRRRLKQVKKLKMLKQYMKKSDRGVRHVQSSCSGSLHGALTSKHGMNDISCGFVTRGVNLESLHASKFIAMPEDDMRLLSDCVAGVQAGSGDLVSSSSPPTCSRTLSLACLPKLHCGKLQYVSSGICSPSLIAVPSLPRIEHGKWQVTPSDEHASGLKHYVSRHCRHAGA
jgi:hypothetical protein